MLTASGSDEGANVIHAPQCAILAQDTQAKMCAYSLYRAVGADDECFNGSGVCKNGS